jgi:hypothetical protein
MPPKSSEPEAAPAEAVAAVPRPLVPAVAMDPVVKQAFEELFTRYKISDEVLKWVTKPEGMGCTSLEDFYYAVTDSSIATIIVKGAKITEQGAQLVQGGRIMQAVGALKQAEEDKRQLKLRGIENTDMDSLLTQPELDGLDDAFWRRYKMRFPAWI